MVAADSGRVPRAPPYLGSPPEAPGFRVRGCHPVPPAFQRRSASLTLSHSARGLQPPPRVPLPRPGNACRLSRRPGLGSSGFARRYCRNHCCFLFLWVLRWFTSPRAPPGAYLVRRRGARAFARAGSPIRTSPDPSPLAAPRGFSQLATSFVAATGQGIRRRPLVAWPPVGAPRRPGRQLPFVGRRALRARRPSIFVLRDLQSCLALKPRSRLRRGGKPSLLPPLRFPKPAPGRPWWA